MYGQFLVVALFFLRLGSAQRQECGGFESLLKKEIRAEVAALLGWRDSERDEARMCGVNTSVIEEVVNATVKQTVVDIQQVVNTTVEKAVSSAIESTTANCGTCSDIHDKLDTALEAVANLSTIVEQLLAPTLAQVHQLQLPGNTPSHPATSCREIKDLHPTSPSGSYWIRSSDGSVIKVVCDMMRTCGGITGGWMPVASVNMSDPSDTCPTGLRMLTSPKRLCGINSDGPGCSSTTFSVQGIQYSRVCGKVIGYQQKTPDAFASYYYNRRLTIDQMYVDGVSITHGHNSRKHIWTFAAALHEILRHENSEHNICPCTNIRNTASIPTPPYVGNDYFCDTGSEHDHEFRFYPDDPLWDGQGCGPLNTCCTFNRPPWFMKQLPSPTNDDIEMRLCTDQAHTDEDIVVEQIELYVQ